MNENKKIEITVRGPEEWQELFLSLPWDANINDWEQAIRVILTHQTFAQEANNELFTNEN